MRGIPEWFEEAACKNATDDMFREKQVDQLLACLKYCKECPVKTDCLAMYLVYSDPHCVAGGMTPNMRARFTGLNRRNARYRPSVFNPPAVKTWLDAKFDWDAHFKRVKYVLRRKGYRGDF